MQIVIWWPCFVSGCQRIAPAASRRPDCNTRTMRIHRAQPPWWTCCAASTHTHITGGGGGSGCVKLYNISLVPSLLLCVITLKNDWNWFISSLSLQWWIILRSPLSEKQNRRSAELLIRLLRYHYAIYALCVPFIFWGYIVMAILKRSIGSNYCDRNQRRNDCSSITNNDRVLLLKFEWNLN